MRDDVVEWTKTDSEMQSSCQQSDAVQTLQSGASPGGRQTRHKVQQCKSAQLQAFAVGSEACRPAAAMTVVTGPTCFDRVPIIGASQADEGCSLPLLSGQESTAAVSHDMQLVVMGGPPVLLGTVKQPACLSVHHGTLRTGVQAAMSRTTVKAC